MFCEVPGMGAGLPGSGHPGYDDVQAWGLDLVKYPCPAV